MRGTQGQCLLKNEELGLACEEEEEDGRRAAADLTGYEVSSFYFYQELGGWLLACLTGSGSLPALQF